MSELTLLRGALERAPTPCFVLLFAQVAARIERLARAFGGRFALAYACKANPNRDLLALLAGSVDYLDVSSQGELERGLAAGWPAERISFTGPGKRDAELDAAVRARLGEVVVESVQEARRLNARAAAAAARQPVLVRIAPAWMPSGFGAQMAGRPSQFGVDEEDCAAAIDAIAALPHLELVGLHAFAGAQCLRAEAASDNLRNCARLFAAACARAGLSPRRLVFGAGFGIPYHEHERELDVEAVAAAVCPALDELRAAPALAATELVLELGRYLVGEAGYYLTRVVGTKSSRGVDICICDGGMNHNLAACGLLGMVIPRNYRFFALTSGGGAPRPQHLVGPLCTALDTLGRGVELPPLAPGDVVAMRGAGAYAATASPVLFIDHPLPYEVVVTEDAGGPTYRVRQLG
jgi:diaminopimelate decarboxylase